MKKEFVIGVQTSEGFKQQYPQFETWEAANLFRTQIYVRTRTLQNFEIREVTVELQ